MAVFNLLLGVVGIILTIYFFVTLSECRKSLDQINRKMSNLIALQSPPVERPAIEQQPAQLSDEYRRKNRRDAAIAFLVLGILAIVILFAYAAKS